MKLIFTILVSVCFLNTLFANPVDEQTALNIAEKFNQLNTNNRLKSGKSFSLIYKCSSTQVSNLKSSNVGAYYYVFGSGDSDFIIVSGDDAALPILGYSTESNFDPNKIPQNVAKWLENYKKQIQYISENNIEADETVKKEWDGILNVQSNLKSAQGSVSPLIQTKWDQSPYYNDLCPYDYKHKERTVTGCPATAMAQIMKYWEYPKIGTGFHSYQSNNYGTLSANFGTTTYDWSNMPNSINSANNAIANLMFHCGVAVEMEYGVDASGSYVIIDEFGNHSYSKEQTVEYALKTYFGYDPTLKGLKRSDFTDTQWKMKLKAELDAKRPIQYAGYGQGGHTFVCDGYDNNEYFHMNWGWSGWYDGYYNLNALNPGTGGVGSSSGTYNNNQQAIVGIKPISNVQNSELKIYKNVSSNNSTISYGAGIVINTDIVNRGTGNFIGDYCAAAFDNDGTFTDYIEIKSETLEAGYHTNIISFTSAGLLSLLPGVYNIYMYYRPTGGEWSQLTADNSSIRDKIQINVVNPNNITLYAPIVLNSSSPIIQGKPLSVSLNVTNTSRIKFNGMIDVSLYDLDGSFIETVEEKSGLSLNYMNYFTNGLTFTTNNLNVKPGTYYLAVFHSKNGDDWELTGSSGTYSNPIKIIVQETPLMPDAYEINNDVSNSSNLIASFSSGNNATINTTGSNIHIGTDIDYYKLSLENGYNYSISPRLQDSNSSNDGQTYTVDASFSYSLDGENWSDTYDDIVSSNIEANGAITIYFRVTPYFSGQTGSYLLDISLSRIISSDPSRSISVHAGGLYEALTTDEKNLITNLTVTGTLDARDFVTLRDYMPKLAVLDISGTSIVAYTGTGGTDGTIINATYPSNTIPQQAFYVYSTNTGKLSLTSIVFPTLITSIGDYALGACNGLTSVTIPSLVNSIGSNAFFSCTGLVSVVIPSAVTAIGDGAFYFSSGLILVDSGNPNYSSLNGLLFDKNKTILIQCPTSIKGSYTIPSMVTSINSYAFAGCSGLLSVIISSSIINIGFNAFYYCSGLINIEAANIYYSSIDGVLLDKNKITLIHYPNSLKGSYTIPSTVKSIISYAFAGCNGLTSITIPFSVTSMDENAFYYCDSLSIIKTINPKPVVLSLNPFSGVNSSTCVLQVPLGSLISYKSAMYWEDFKSIVEMDTPNGINEPDLSSLTKIYASAQTVYVCFTENPKNARIAIYDMNGRLIVSKVADEELIAIPIDRCGIYVVRIEAENRIQTKKIIIQ